MKKYFNIAGPCHSKKHYMVPILNRNKSILPLIAQDQYFVIHAARQTGKTTLVKALVNYFNSEGTHHALYCSLEAASPYTEVKEGIVQVFYILERAIKYSNLPHRATFGKDAALEKTASLLSTVLVDFCQKLDKPLIIFFDEIDCLKNGTLISFLRQLREGYVNRPEIPFPQSVSLIGMRNIRDYKSKIRENRQTLGSASPFNIITEALTLINFTFEEVIQLYDQHTQATGQKFDKTIIEKIYKITNGQPWLVNAIAREIIVKLLNDDYSQKITTHHVDQAVKNIILRRDTHIDSLLERLKEERVRKVIEPLLTGRRFAIDLTDDDTQYCIDLGLLMYHNGELKPANGIYKEVIIRALTANTQAHLKGMVKNRWVTENGGLDMSGILKAFQQFWRENSGIWEEKYQYKEAAPHLILQAFLQTVINSGGRVSREYAANKDRMDLCIHYGGHQYPIEIKLHYDTKTIPNGLIQLSEYMDVVGEATGWLVVFDKRKTKTWEEKIFWKMMLNEGKTIFVVGC